MSEFQPALQKVLAHEGGYVNDPDDPGGETYRGVARNMHSKWSGWVRIDMCKNQSGFPANLEKDAELQDEIARFYQINFWDKINGDNIQNQLVANSIFDFSVNAGVKTSASLAQLVVETEADGVIGPQSLEKINAFDPDHFLAVFTLAKIARYMAIIRKRPASKKYLYGWITRALE
ncbi:MAG: glycosyl hydrolase 108 family protein [Paludibacter sp.]